jgi:hypothetical protein
LANAAQLPNIRTLGWSPFRTDVFGRTKVSNPQTIFESENFYVPSYQYSTEAVGGAGLTHLPSESAVALSVTGESGSRVSIESRRVMPYQPGKSLQVLQSFQFASPSPGLRQRVGYFSRRDGVYLERLGGEATLVLRSSVSGSVLETRVPQSAWNVDPLDGTGDTSLVLDLDRSQILWLELEWLGVGSVRVGFAYNGTFVTTHQFDHANVGDTTYMRTACLPVRVEVESLESGSGASSMRHICASVISNGGFDDRPTATFVTRESAVGTTLIPMVAIRLAPGRENAVVLPGRDEVTPLAAGNFQFSLLRNPVLTGGTWVTEERGNVQYNVSATGVTGGTVVRTGYITSTNQATPIAALDGLDRVDLQLGRTNSDTPVSDVLVLAVRTLSGNSSVAVASSWFELN